MSRPEDFDIVQDEDEDDVGPARRSSARWLWLGGATALIVLAGAFALSTFAQRISAPPTPIPLVESTPQPTSLATAIAAAPDATESVTPEASPTATATEPPTSEPSPTPCSIAVNDTFANRYSRDRLGCPTAAGQIVWSAWQPFQGGHMIWRSDTDQAFVLSNTGIYSPIEEQWDGGSPPDRGSPPPDLYAPERGFGAVWARSDQIFNTLGWATAPERGYCALIQDYEYGSIIVSDPTPSCTADNLYNHAAGGEWTPLYFRLTEDGRWADAAGASVQPPAATSPTAPTPPSGGADVTRPSQHGIWNARRMAQPALDADFGDWPTNWIPISNLIHGADRHRGSQDLYAEVQFGWDSSGLYIATRVQDDQYRASPAGTTMWQGDSFEIHFDRQLAADFDSASMSDDDYQIGVSFGPDLNAIRGYRWLPSTLETPLTLPGAVRPVEGGYGTEFQIPWHVFEVDNNRVAPGNTFGLNFSVNDNDSDVPAQEKTASASPMRTTHDNPTEWGTLVLGE